MAPDTESWQHVFLASGKSTLPPTSFLLLQVIPLNSAGSPVGDVPFVRSGLLGFVGPVCNVASELLIACANGLEYLKEEHLCLETCVCGFLL